MKFTKLAIFMVCILALKAADTHWGIEEVDDVAVLTNDNFENFIKENKYVFVKFYAPWCGHCKSMAPGYSKLGKKMKTEENGIPIGKVDATIEKELAEKFGVQGFPTLKLFVEGEPVDYQGGREEDEIYNWIQKKTGPSSTEITTVEDFEKHSALSVSVLLIFPEGEEEALKKYMAVAMSYDDVPFAHTSNTEIKTKLEVNEKFAFVVFRDFDDGRKFLVNDETLTTDSMKNFFNSVRFPIVMDFDQKAAERIFGGETSAMIFFSDDSTDSNLTAFKTFAKANSGKILFTYSTISDGLGARLSEFIGITAVDSPAVRIIKFREGNLDKYRIDDITESGLASSLTDFESGALKAYYKSEAIPETNDESVKTIVGDTFESMVLKADKYVLFEAYAPWCGHCKKLEPIYKELADKLASVEDVVIAKMDATANEHPTLSVQGFPTIKLYKPDSETPVDYTGDRSLDDLVKFLETETGKKFDEFKTTEM